MAKTAHQLIASLEAQIAALQGKLDVARVQAANEIDYSLVQAGVTVTFNYGRADTARVYTGVVLGRRDPAPGEKGAPFVKVAVGEGFDAAIFTITPSAVTAINAPEAEAAAE